MAADLLTQVAGELDARLAELRPAVDEYEQLLGAAGVLDADQQQAARARSSEVASPASAAGAGSASAPPEAKTKAAATRTRKPSTRGKSASVKRSLRSPRARTRSAVTPAQEAIVAALEHGSHTVSELVLVTAMSGADIREGLRRLLKAGTVVRARREGRTAYALSAIA